MQKYKSFLFIMLSVMLATVQACNLPAGGTATQAPAGNEALIAAQKTVDAINQTQTANAPIVTETSTLTPAPTVTFTPAFTSTPALTSTPVFPYVTLSVGTNCRTGPDKVYTLIDTFLPGQTIEVLGRSPGGEYWYVRSPNNQAVFCWMWGAYASGGNLNGVAVFTPPPSPTPAPAPNFDLSYTKMETCGSVWWLDFTVKNTGTSALESISFSGKDTVTGELLSGYDNSFTDKGIGCSGAASISKLDLGASTIASSPELTANPAGHKIKITIKVCTLDETAGKCVSQSLTFTP